MVKYLIKAGADVNCIDEAGKSPLLLALQDGKFKIAQYLMKQGSDVNIVDELGQSALFLIANGGNNDCLKTVKKLMKYGRFYLVCIQWNQYIILKLVTLKIENNHYNLQELPSQIIIHFVSSYF